ncbi:alpha-amylase [Candidatus Woesearchaeota archaeon CG1_02_57_44]|nr:MAG: alpha-amylase [Candidatus Woesearchaeota archaeon CG1_02_57_44]
MVSVCMYFQVHQPHRLRQYNIFDIGKHQQYFDDEKNREILLRVARKCYIPATNLIYNKINQLGGKFRVSYSLTGTFLEQAQKYSPELIRLFHKLAKTGCCEFLSETYYHSLAALYNEEEFKQQVGMHKKLMKDLFGQSPKVFRNTELIFTNRIAQIVEQMGYKAIIAEGTEKILSWRSPNYLYQPAGTRKIKALLKNYRLSDDIAFRFGNKEWKAYPLTAPQFAQWVSADQSSHCINLFMDYETFGEHQWATTGIFKFLEHMPNEVLSHPNNEFLTPSQVADKYQPVGEIDAPYPVSWADVERDTSAWTGNDMQRSSLAKLYLLKDEVESLQDPEALEIWRKLQTSDHFYYMCTKWFADGDVHKYFNPYESPYESYITMMNVLNDFAIMRQKKRREMTASSLSDSEAELDTQAQESLQPEAALEEFQTQLVPDAVPELQESSVILS